MSIRSDVFVIELVSDEEVEIQDVWPSFEQSMELFETSPMRRWVYGDSLYVVVRDPELQIFSAVAQIEGVEISNAARLELSEELRVADKDIEEFLPSTLGAAIEFPHPSLAPHDSVRPEHSPLIVCPDPHCPDHIHPAPACPDRASKPDRSPPSKPQPPAPAG